MQIRRRDGELEDDREEGEAKGLIGEGCLCVRVSRRRERREDEDRGSGIERQTSSVYVVFAVTAITLSSTGPQQHRSSYRPQRGSAHQLCHGNFTLNCLSSQVRRAIVE